MGEVVVLQPLEETLTLVAEAQAKMDSLLAAMIHLARRILTAPATGEDIYSINEEKIELVRQFYAVKERFELLESLADSIHANRAHVWEHMPDRVPSGIIAFEGNKIVVLRATRQTAQLVCTDFHMFEVDPSGELTSLEVQVRRASAS